MPILGGLYYYIVLPNNEGKASITRSIDTLTGEITKKRALNKLLLPLQEGESIERVIRVDKVEFKQIGEEGFAVKNQMKALL